MTESAVEDPPWIVQAIGSSSSSLFLEAQPEVKVDVNAPAPMEHQTNEESMSYDGLRLALIRKEKAKLSEEFDQALRTLYSDLFPEHLAVAYGLLPDFRRHAGHVGTSWTNLAWTAGFPDPDPESRRSVDAADILDKDLLVRAKAARKEIALADAAFRKLVSGRLESVLEQKRAAESILLANYYRELDEIDRKQSLSQMTKEGTSETYSLQVKNRYVIPSTESLRSGVYLRGYAPNIPRTDDTAMRDLTARLENDRRKLFATIRRYVITAEPDNRDVTEEYLQWRENVAPGL